MDILLASSYFLYQDPHEQAIMKPYTPLGLAYLSSHLKAAGLDAQIFDATFATWEAFCERVAGARPPIVGIYGTLLTRKEMLRMITFCKGQGCTVVLGGPEPANYAEEYLERGADIVVIGEGERTLEELVPHIARFGQGGLEQIQGIVYRRDDGQALRTPARPFITDLDAQPFPDREAMDIPAYLRAWREHHGQGSLSLITARGCPYRCSWCSHAVFGYSHRRRSPQNVANEIALIRERYQPDQLWFADDVFTFHRQGLFGLAQELKQRGIHIPFETISREDRLDEEVVRTLADMGCRRLWIGSESGSQRVIDAMGRGIDVQRTRAMTRLLQRYGIETGMFIMLGYEGEEAEDIKATIEHLKAANPDLFLSVVAYPVKGTPYYEAVADRVITRGPWEEGSDGSNTVAGRHSPRFYRFAARRMQAEVALHRGRQGAGGGWRRLTRLAEAGVGRLGMRLTEHEVEH